MKICFTILIRKTVTYVYSVYILQKSKKTNTDETNIVPKKNVGWTHEYYTLNFKNCKNLY